MASRTISRHFTVEIPAGGTARTPGTGRLRISACLSLPCRWLRDPSLGFLGFATTQRGSGSWRRPTVPLAAICCSRCSIPPHWAPNAEGGAPGANVVTLNGMGASTLTRALPINPPESPEVTAAIDLRSRAAPDPPPALDPAHPTPNVKPTPGMATANASSNLLRAKRWVATPDRNPVGSSQLPGTRALNPEATGRACCARPKHPCASRPAVVPHRPVQAVPCFSRRESQGRSTGT